MDMRFDQRGHGIPEVAPPPPTDKVLEWRRERLLAVGFDELLAEQLAEDSATDLHEVLNLVDRGCPPELAARILDSRTGTHG